MILGLKVQLRGPEAKDPGLEAVQDPDPVQDLEVLRCKDQDQALQNKTPSPKKKWLKIIILRKTTLRNPDQNLDRNPDQNPDQNLDQNPDQNPDLNPDRSLDQNPDRNLDRNPDRGQGQSRLGPKDPNPDPRLDLRDPSPDHQYQDRVQGLPPATAQDLVRGQDQLRLL